MEDEDKNIEPCRVGNLAFNKATYLGKEPKYVSWHIDYWYPNSYYGKETEYTKIDGGYYVDPNIPNWRISEGCFKYKECSLAICSFDYNEHEGNYELKFIDDRPVRYMEENKINPIVFYNLLDYGFKQLNPSWYEEDKE